MVFKEILLGKVEPGVETPLTYRESVLKFKPWGRVSTKLTFVILFEALGFSTVMVYSIVFPTAATWLIALLDLSDLVTLGSIRSEIG